jgi:hypothetical protein
LRFLGLQRLPGAIRLALAGAAIALEDLLGEGFIEGGERGLTEGKRVK